MMDDAGVPVIGGMPIKDGWRTETVVVRGRSEEVFISPDGDAYVRATESERADLVVHRISKRYADPLHVRFRLSKDSALMKQQRREKRLVARGEQKRNEKFQEAFGPDHLPNDALAKTKKIRRKR